MSFSRERPVNRDFLMTPGRFPRRDEAESDNAAPMTPRTTPRPEGTEGRQFTHMVSDSSALIGA